MKFKTTLLQAGKTATGICVPDTIVEELGAGKRPAVAVTINGYTYRSTVAVMGGDFMVGVSAEVREAAGVSGGDTITIDIVLDTQPRVIAVPKELLTALKSDPIALQAFEALSNSKKQRYTLPVEKAKTEETKNRNIQKALNELHPH